MSNARAADLAEAVGVLGEPSAFDLARDPHQRAFLAAALVARGSEITDASATASQWAAVLLALGVVAVFLGGWASDRFGRARSAFAIALASGAISLTFGALFDAPWTLVLLVGAVYGGLIGADSAIYSTAVTELAPAGRIGSAQAIQAVAGFGIGSLGPVVAGAALDLGTGWLGPFVVAGLTDRPRSKGDHGPGIIRAC